MGGPHTAFSHCVMVCESTCLSVHAAVHVVCVYVWLRACQLSPVAWVWVCVCACMCLHEMLEVKGEVSRMAACLSLHYLCYNSFSYRWPSRRGLAEPAPVESSILTYSFRNASASLKGKKGTLKASARATVLRHLWQPHIHPFIIWFCRARSAQLPWLDGFSLLELQCRDPRRTHDGGTVSSPPQMETAHWFSNSPSLLALSLSRSFFPVFFFPLLLWRSCVVSDDLSLATIPHNFLFQAQTRVPYITPFPTLSLFSLIYCTASFVRTWGEKSPLKSAFKKRI